MFNLGMGEITVILLLALIFLGPSKLPDLASGLGKLIKEIRKATSDVKNEIALDDSFRKPFEELRDAVTLHPDELKRRDQWRKDSEEAAKRAAEDLARSEADKDKGPPDGLVSPFSVPGASPPDLSTKPDGEPRPGPNDTIVQTAPPRGATLDDIPTPPPEVPLAPAKPPGRPAKLTPAGTVARPETLRNMKPLGTPAARPATAPPPAPGASSATPASPPPAPTAPSAASAAPRPAPAAPSGPSAAPPLAPASTTASANGDNAANITQILKEEDLLPAVSSGKPPPPPHLPGLRPVGPAVPRPGVASPSPSTPADKKKP